MAPCLAVVTILDIPQYVTAGGPVYAKASIQVLLPPGKKLTAIQPLNVHRSIYSGLWVVFEDGEGAVGVCEWPERNNPIQTTFGYQIDEFSGYSAVARTE